MIDFAVFDAGQVSRHCGAPADLPGRSPLIAMSDGYSEMAGRDRRSGSSNSSTGLKGRPRNEIPADGETRDHSIAASASNMVSPSSMLSRYGSATSSQVSCRTASSATPSPTPEPMGISDALHRGRQHAGRQQPPGARHQDFRHWPEIQRYRRQSQGQRHRLQLGADLTRLIRRAARMVAPRSHRTASSRFRY